MVLRFGEGEEGRRKASSWRRGRGRGHPSCCIATSFREGEGKISRGKERGGLCCVQGPNFQRGPSSFEGEERGRTEVQAHSFRSLKEQEMPDASSPGGLFADFHDFRIVRSNHWSSIDCLVKKKTPFEETMLLGDAARRKAKVESCSPSSSSSTSMISSSPFSSTGSAFTRFCFHRAWALLAWIEQGSKSIGLSLV